MTSPMTSRRLIIARQAEDIDLRDCDFEHSVSVRVHVCKRDSLLDMLQRNRATAGVRFYLVRLPSTGWAKLNGATLYI